MEVSLIKEGYTRAILRFSTGPMDAEPPLREVFFEGDKLGRVSDHRWALIALLMCRELVGNCVTLDGFSIPPHLAAAFEKDVVASELFLSPIDNEPKKILPRDNERVTSLLFSASAGVVGLGSLVGTEYELGFHFFLPGADECDMPTLKTNLRLWAALSDSRVDLISRTIVALIASDVYGVRECEVGLREVSDRDFSERVEILCREAGVNVS
jgi:hypothetical protein